VRSVKRHASVLLAAATALAGLALPAEGGAAVPSVRVLAGTHRVTLHRYGPRVILNLGVFAASVGGDFELRASRPDYSSPVGVVQVDGQTGDVLRTLPSDTLDGWHGLGDFFGVAFRDADGAVVARGHFGFCPNGYDRERVSDSGPSEPRYPEFCDLGSPFQRGMVWGIDDGWAVSALGFSSGGRPARIRVPNGRYSVRARITDRFQDLLDVAPGDGSVGLHATVKGRRHRPGEPIPVERSGGAAAKSSVPTVTDPDPGTVPDLAALPAWNIALRRDHGRDVLDFAATEWNAGPAPLDVEGFRRPREPVMAAYQYFQDADGNVVGRAPVGRLEYDDRHGHHHWHFRQFAAYSLLDADRTRVVRSHKQSFCIAPTDAIDLTLPGADWRAFDGGLGSACGDATSIWVRERLEVGWGDTYFQSVAGQSFDVTDLPNGRYYVRVAVNPAGKLYDGSTADDSKLRRIHLGGRPGHRTLRVFPWHGIDA
jgi:hypothetical protein